MLTRPTKPVNSPNSPTITLTHPKSRFRYFWDRTNPLSRQENNPKIQVYSYMSTSYAISLGDFTITITARSQLSGHFCKKMRIFGRIFIEYWGLCGVIVIRGFRMQMLNKSGRKMRFKAFHNHNDLWAKLTFSGQYIQSFRFHCPNSNWWFH